jgi:hypothetical protein
MGRIRLYLLLLPLLLLSCSTTAHADLGGMDRPQEIPGRTTASFSSDAEVHATLQDGSRLHMNSGGGLRSEEERDARARERELRREHRAARASSPQNERYMHVGRASDEDRERRQQRRAARDERIQHHQARTDGAGDDDQMEGDPTAQPLPTQDGGAEGPGYVRVDVGAGGVSIECKDGPRDEAMDLRLPGLRLRL